MNEEQLSVESICIRYLQDVCEQSKASLCFLVFWWEQVELVGCIWGQQGTTGAVNLGQREWALSSHPEVAEVSWWGETRRSCFLSWEEAVFFAENAGSENEFEPEPVVLQV